MHDATQDAAEGPVRDEEPRKAPRHRSRLLAVIIAFFAFLGVAIAVMLAFVLQWIWNPPADDTAHADAIVVLAYGQDRLQEGRRLAESGASDNLILSISNRMETNIEEGRLPVLTPAEVGYEAEDEDEDEDEVEDGDGSSTRSPSGANSSGAWVEQCDTWYTDYYTWCFNPDPNTTEGEAMAVADLMTTNDWDSVLVVTERSHLNRALRIFESCVDADISGATSARSGPWYRDLWRSAYEVAAIAKTATLGACSS